MKLKELSIRFPKYLLVAAGAATVDWMIFIMLLDFFNFGSIYSQAVSRLGGGVFSFCLNKVFSFKAPGLNLIFSETRRFLFLYLVSYCLSLSMMYLGIKVVGFPPYWTKLVSDTTCFLFNFMVMNYYVFSGNSGITDYLLRTAGFRKSVPVSVLGDSGEKNICRRPEP